MKAKKLICLATVAVMAASMAAVFAGCGEEKVSVEWMTSAREVLKTDKVTKGSKVQDWTPSADQTPEGKTFVGWYEEASYATKFKFDTVINEDTRIYAQWRNAQTAADTRIWYAIGTGAGTMKASNWTYATEDLTTDSDGNPVYTKKKDFDSMFLSKAETSNTFTITLTLYAGDQFQLLTNATKEKTDWSGPYLNARAGFGNIEGAEIEGESGVVKDSAGKTVFVGSKGYDADPQKWNIEVAEGADGIYEFTFETYPGEDTNNVLKWKWKGDAPVMAATHKMYLIGSIGEPNVWVDNASEDTYFTQDKDHKELWRKYITITEDNYVTAWGENENGYAWVKVKNEISGKDYGVDGGSSNIQLTAGTWCITYNSDTNKTAAEKLDYYVVGTLYDGEEAVNFGSIKKDFAKMTSTDGVTYTYELVVTDVSDTKDYSWLKGNNAIFAIQVAYGAGVGGAKDWYSAKNSGLGTEDNYYFTEAGTYTITFNATTSQWTVEKK